MYSDYSYSVSPVSSTAALAGMGIYLIIMLAMIAFFVICEWKIYKKAGKNGWEAIVPIYNIVVLLDIVKLPTWYIVLLLIPFAQIYAIFKIFIELAKKFGKDSGFGVFLVFFSFIGLPMLAFGSAQYTDTENNASLNNDASQQNNNQSVQNNVMNQNINGPQPMNISNQSINVPQQMNDNVNNNQSNI